MEPIFAISATELPESGLPESIMWMPAGTHQIVASQGGKATRLTVNVDAGTAKVAQAALEQYRAAADAGSGDRMFFDLNHNDCEASAHPQEFYFAGNDPKTGGVRAKVVWTAAGAAAVLGKNYRRFSPSFFAKDGRVIGVPVNAGGAVNRAAFTKIAPLISDVDRIAAKGIRETVIAIQSKDDFLTTGQLIAVQRGIDAGEAYEALAYESPIAYSHYLAALGLGSHVFHQKLATAQANAVTSAAGQNALDLASAIAAKGGLQEAEALEAIIAKNADWYDYYRASLGLGSLQFQARFAGQPEPELLTTDAADIAATIAAAMQGSNKLYSAYQASMGLGKGSMEEQNDLSHPFSQKVKEMEEKHSLSFGSAYALVAQKWPELFESYREALAGPSPDDVTDAGSEEPSDYNAYRANLLGLNQ